MNKEATLQAIKNKLAKEYDYEDWSQLVKEMSDDAPIDFIMYTDEVAKRYAIAMCDRQKKQCAIEARTMVVFDEEVHAYDPRPVSEIKIDKDSILESNNVAE